MVLWIIVPASMKWLEEMKCGHGSGMQLNIVVSNKKSTGQGRQDLEKCHRLNIQHPAKKRATHHAHHFSLFPGKGNCLLFWEESSSPIHLNTLCHSFKDLGFWTPKPGSQGLFWLSNSHPYPIHNQLGGRERNRTSRRCKRWLTFQIASQHRFFFF